AGLAPRPLGPVRRGNPGATPSGVGGNPGRAMIVARPMKTVVLRLLVASSVAVSMAACSGAAAPTASQAAASPPGAVNSPAAAAGPTCPVVSDNDPTCAERPVAGATVHIVATDGTEVATLTTDAQGRFSADLEPGAYQVVADDAAGLMHRPDPVAITVTNGVV